MKDLCLTADEEPVLTTALTNLGLSVTDEEGNASISGDYLFLGAVVQTPGELDPETGDVVTEPSYLDGVYAILRTSDATAALLSNAAASNAAFALVDPPAGLPMFGGEWLTPDLEALKAAACARIDAAAENLCNNVVTPGSAQMARYARKQAQAEAFLVDASPSADAYPAIYGEVGITADTAQGVAEAVMARATAWWAYGDAIERVRLAGKQAVNAASSVAGINAAEAAVAWPAAA